MGLARVLLGTLIAHLPLSHAKSNCPLYGPLFPHPTNLGQDAGIKGVAAILDNVFIQHIDGDNSTGSENFSYAVEVFSGSEDKPLWSHYWTAPNLKTLNSTGVSKVDTNTVFRIGSVTKIFNVLAFLAAVGDGIWNDPVTKYLPELEEIASKAAGGPIYSTDWEAITVGSLASQMSGLIRDYALLGELSYQINMTDLYSMGFPPLPDTEFPPCGTNPTCNRTQLYAGLAKLPPSFASFTTPVYSDIGFVLLSYVAERITGKPFKDLVADSVLAPLNLTHTFVKAPEDALGIIPGTKRTTLWGFDLGEEAPTGNMYTSAGDLSSLGRAILRSTLIKPAMTRRWFKPASFSSDPQAGVGMPWGIRRIELEKNQTYQSIHTYNKIGSLGSYSALFALLPELDMGITVLAAGDLPAGITNAIAEALTQTYIPTLSYIARAQTAATYAGHYVHPSLLNTTAGANTTTPIVNSSLTISVDTTAPGLNLTAWLSNGTAMAPIAVGLNANVSTDYLPKMKPSVRLYPTGLQQQVQDGEEAAVSAVRKVAFKAVFEDLSLPESSGSFVTDCASWVGVTSVVYGSRPLDLFVFEVGADGRVRAVVNEALRVRLVKVD